MTASATTQDVPRDWRGTSINPGDLVIYGAPVGRSIALVEGYVEGFTKSGRVNIRIARRAYGAWGTTKEVVHVGQDRLVVVTELPPSDVPLTSDQIVERQKRNRERKDAIASHSFPEYEPSPTKPWSSDGYGARVCTKGCGLTWADVSWVPNDQPYRKCTG